LGRVAVTAVGTIAGALIGSRFGNAQLGAQIGASVGALAGDALFPPDPTVIRGPQIGDLLDSGADYGTPIPISYGTTRIPGQLIWAQTRVIETETESGGKGSSEPTTISRFETAFADVAYSFGEGPADDILQLYLNGQLVFDKTPGPITMDIGITFRFYPGDEEQLPDPLIESVEGVGRTPAYRGQVIVVIPNLELTRFGNTVPKLVEALIAKASTPATASLSLTRISSFGAQDDERYPDFLRGFIYSSGTDGVNYYIARFRLSDLVEDRFVTFAGLTAVEIRAVLPTGELFVEHSPSYRIVDPVSFVTRYSFPRSGTGTFSTTTFGLMGSGGRADVMSAVGPKGLVQFIMVTSSVASTKIGLLRFGLEEKPLFGDVQELSYLFIATLPAGISTFGCCAGFPAAGLSFGYVLAGSLTTGVYLVKLTVSAIAQYFADLDLTTGVIVNSFSNVAPGDIVSGETTFTRIRGLTFDETDGNVILGVGYAGDQSKDYLVKLSTNDGSIIWVTKVSAVPPIAMQNHSRLQNGTYGVLGAASFQSYVIDTTTGDFLEQRTIGGVNFTSQFYDSRTALVYGSTPLQAHSFFRRSGDGELLSDVVTDLCLRAGLDASEIDVSQLTDTVRGLAIARQTSVRSVLEILQGAYFFDSIETDYKLKHVKRGAASVATIPEDDLADVDGSNVLPESREQEADLPKRLFLRYLDADKQQIPNTAQSQRIGLPNRASVTTRSEITVDIPLVLTAQEAKRITERRLYAAYVGRVSFAARTPWKYLALDPSDVVTINMATVSRLVRIRQLSVGSPGFALEMGLAQEDAPVYTSGALADAGDGAPSQTFAYQGASKLFVLDIPLLRNGDEAGPASSLRYYAGSFFQDGINWPGMTVFQSVDDQVGTPIVSILSRSIWGSAVTALAAPASPFRTDDVNSVTVSIAVGSDDLASATQDDLYNGANVALLGEEIIQFGDITDNGDGSFTLSRLLRARRGTDPFVGIHAAGDLFLVLTTSTVKLGLTQIPDLGRSLFFRGVTRGTVPIRTPAEVFVLEGRDLKPYAPVFPTRADNTPSSGDITLGWTRRSRLGGGSLSVSPQLAEATEAYEVDILSGAGGTLKRTLTATTNSVVYTAANISTDFGSTPSPLYFRVYQISAVVGRGFASEEFAL